MKMPLRRKVKRSSRTAAASGQEQRETPVGGDGERGKRRMRKRTEAKGSAAGGQELEAEPETTEDSHGNTISVWAPHSCCVNVWSCVHRLCAIHPIENS